MIQLKNDLVISQPSGEITTYPKDKFCLKPRISIIADEEVSIEFMVSTSEGQVRSHFGHLRFRGEDPEYSYKSAIKHVDNGTIKESGLSWLREKTINSIHLKNLI